MKKNTSNKFTYEEVYNTFKEHGYELLDKEYKNDKTKMKIKDNDGYLYSVTYRSLKNLNTEFQKVSQNNPYSMHNIKLYLKLNNINMKILDDKYISNNSKIKCVCKCNDMFYTTWASISSKQKYTCNKCSRERTAYVQRDTIDILRKAVESFGNKLLTSEYKNQNQILDIKCKCGEIYQQKASRYKQGKMTNCKKCLEELDKYFAINNARNKYFNKEDYFPCEFCNKDCVGISKCKIISVLKYNKRNKPNNNWNGKEYFTIFDEIINNNENIMNNISNKLNNKTVNELCDIISDELKIGGSKELRVKCNCSVCGKETTRKMYLRNSKYCYCSDECKSKQSILMMKDGIIKHTLTKPHLEINNLLESMKISYVNEYNLKYHSIDIYCDKFNIPIEIMGDYWHSIPIKYSANVLSDVQKKDIKQDKSKHTYVSKYFNTEILYLWESDIKCNLELCKKLILLYINNKGLLSDYQSYNYHIDDKNELTLNDNIINPYFIKQTNV